MHSGEDRLWRVGELARTSGLSVRALHHYEQVGLMSARGRTSGGHRLYSSEDVRRLYQIRALREFGLSLTETASALDGSVSLDSVLRTHLQHVETRLAQLSSLRDWLAAACVQAGALPSTESLLATLEAMSVIAGHTRNRRPSDTRHAWTALGQELRTLRDAGQPSSSSTVIELAQAARDLINSFADHDQAVLDALAHLRRNAPQLDAAGWDQDLIEFLDDALTALDRQEDLR
ncbi:MULTISPECIES: MerR family transcriptional regulator [Mycolicibacterium]|jgi:DNA-binding transcriptional MerR regulator|uniref:MerR family transcriptional regulator n=1 Tax=Mycolicibacterium TaxID=1866885 RepID=UPI000569920F|nr:MULTISPECIES: MerR family transcriptional regulator [Mycolicibacterium]MDW5610092.1 MerR family transcriptional regulator [Mycolicibacterium sp. D5.8-2]QRZ07123.1 MerR family transcriptional regulator [Mycolicibacterium austroafricanum]QZT57149.1 MerR family transcriptional regulator [Mycolicibacterium austroafricanum]QZT68608.1 MerR family transcriptional regulator [Mycolicibacterium austroafricanum]QZY46323.1 MerR family transcriptional regulator [Mycolicibacterium austroafricanum]